MFLQLFYACISEIFFLPVGGQDLTGCQYISVMEPLSELYCNPYRVDSDFNRVYTGCGVVYPLSGQPVVEFQWFRRIRMDRGNGNVGDVEDQQISNVADLTTLQEENSSHKTLMVVGRVEIQETTATQEVWCRAVLSNGTYLQSSQVMSVLSAPTYSISPRCLKDDILSTNASKCLDPIVAGDVGDLPMGNNESMPVVVINSQLSTRPTTTVSVSRQSVSTTRSSRTCSNEPSTNVRSVSTTYNTETILPISQASSTYFSNNFLTTSLPVVAVLLTCVVVQFTINIVLCCKRKNNSAQRQEKPIPTSTSINVHHNTVTQTSSVESPFYNMEPSYYIAPRSIASTPPSRMNISSSLCENSNEVNQGTVNTQEMYDSVSGLYHEILEREELESNTYAPLSEGTMNRNNVYACTNSTKSYTSNN